MHTPRIRHILALAGLWAALAPSLVLAIGVSAGTEITVVGEERLTSSAKQTLRAILTQIPPAFYPHLQAITVDSAPLPPAIAASRCDLGGYPGPCRINILSGYAGQQENPFPPDAPVQVESSTYYAIAAHEIGHNVALYADTTRGALWWRDQLVSEAGCDPEQYLRSMFPSCFFRDAPQELAASMINQWLTCSTCTIGLALSRWDRGVRHPMDQIVYLLWLFGGQPAQGPAWPPAGMTLFYGYDQALRLPSVTTISVRPWACNGIVEIAGPAVALTVRLDDGCRVTDVLSREGLD
jgi:hypothetical protein